jgi:PKD repeat protein
MAASWVKVANRPGANSYPFESGGLVVYNGELYGLNIDLTGSISNFRISEMKFTGTSWSILATNTTAEYRPSYTQVILNNKLYFAAGSAGRPKLLEFDPSNNNLVTVTAPTDANAYRNEPYAIGVYNSSVYFCPGGDYGGVYLLKYTAPSTLTLVADRLGNYYRETKCLQVFNGTLYAAIDEFGGTHGYVYEFTGSAWIERAVYSHKIHQAFVANNNLYFTSPGNGYLGEILQYDSVNHTLTVVATTSAAFSYSNQVRVVNNEAYFYVYGVANTPSFCKFNPTTNTVTIIASVYLPSVTTFYDLCYYNSEWYTVGYTRDLYKFIPPEIPVADFSGTPLSGKVPLSVSFTDTSTGSPTSWNWDFGDSTAHSTLRNPTHNYTTSGLFSVTLVATNADGSGTKTSTGYITADINADFSVNVTTGVSTLMVSFTDISTGGPTGWEWDFGDGVTSTEHNPTHTYLYPGVYTVVLRAFNLVSSGTVTKEELIKIDFFGSVTKHKYINVASILSTEDTAPPVTRPDLRTMYANGIANYLFIKKGVRVFISQNAPAVFSSGFKRAQGPTILFD